MIIEIRISKLVKPLFSLTAKVASDIKEGAVAIAIEGVYFKVQSPTASAPHDIQTENLLETEGLFDPLGVMETHIIQTKRLDFHLHRRVQTVGQVFFSDPLRGRGLTNRRVGLKPRCCCSHLFHNLTCFLSQSSPLLGRRNPVIVFSLHLGKQVGLLDIGVMKVSPNPNLLAVGAKMATTRRVHTAVAKSIGKVTVVGNLNHSNLGSHSVSCCSSTHSHFISIFFRPPRHHRHTPHPAPDTTGGHPEQGGHPADGGHPEGGSFRAG